MLESFHMRAVPRENLTPRSTINTASGNIGRSILAMGVNLAGAAAAWPLTNLAIYFPFQLDERSIVYSVYWMTGTGAGGNVDVGIFDSAGVKLQSTGSVSRGSASAFVTNDWTDLTLDPGQYWGGLSVDGTSNMGAITTMAAGLCQAMGIAEQTSAFALPSTATFTGTTRAYIPNFGFILRSVVP